MNSSCVHRHRTMTGPVPRLSLAALLLGACASGQSDARENYVDTTPVPRSRVSLSTSSRILPVRETLVYHSFAQEWDDEQPLGYESGASLQARIEPVGDGIRIAIEAGADRAEVLTDLRGLARDDQGQTALGAELIE